ncbi:MAG: Na(+)/H(+) antiporter subunit D [Gemmatimonadetes bacterium]|nr:Na(+)/H(+) antiporter subunit D [Gemmatimonadota bacterium]
MSSMPPAAVMILGAVLVPFLRGRLRTAYVLALPLAGLALVLSMGDTEFGRTTLFGHELTLVRIDGLSRLFGWLFHIAAFIGLVFALRSPSRIERPAALVYAGAAVGAVQAGDLVTLFVFWEILAVSSVFLVWARRGERSFRAGMRYLIVQIGSGALLLAGILVYANATGSVAFGDIGLDSPGGLVIMLAFGVKAAFPMLHTWLTDAYPESTYSGAVFLSAFTTKVAVYALARGFAGEAALVWIGAAMTSFPIFYAVIENDLRRVLGYSMINQLGFMVCGIGIGTELAVNGAVAHAFNDVLFKGLLFMSMGAVLYRTGNINGSDLGGLYKSMPKTAGLCMVGAASISAFPRFCGFVSKSLVMGAALYEGYNVVWLMLLFASAGVFHHAGIKIPFFAFFAHDSGIRVKEAPNSMLIAMTVAAVLSMVNGVWPTLFLYPNLPYEVTYQPFTSAHTIGQLQILFFSALAFCGLKLTGLYPPELRSVNLDIDWIVRRPLNRLALALGRTGKTMDVQLRTAADGLVRRTLRRAFVAHGPRGVLARSWPAGSTVLWVATLLAAFLLIQFL